MVARFERFRAAEEPDVVIRQVAERCRALRVQFIAADGGGNGYVYNQLLAKELDFKCTLYAIMYSTSEQAPHQEGLLWRWPVGRSASIGVEAKAFPATLDAQSCRGETADHPRSHQLQRSGKKG